MKVNLLAAGAFAVALAMPLGVLAQQAQYPSQAPNQQTQRPMPSPQKVQHRWMKRLQNLNLSADQQQRIQSIFDQYSQAHPEGSQREPGSGRELRRQIMGVLSSDQQNQLHQEMRARHSQRGAQQQGGPQQQPNGPQDQGPPPDQQQPPQQGPPAAPPA